MTATSPDARRIWSVAKGPTLVALVILASSLIVALLSAPGEGGELDPRSATEQGTRALAKLLERQGVTVEFTETTPSTVDDATLLVTRPDLLAPEHLAALRPADLVLVAPTQWLPPGAQVAGGSDVQDQQPGCAWAARFGEATTGGVEYTGGDSCYGGSVVRLGSVTLLGTGAPMMNKSLADKGNAALAMTVLGRHQKLVWYSPAVADPGQQRSLIALLPDGWKFGLLQLIVAIVLLGLWRARRLGPVVAEPLPVVVRAAETVEGRARLYRRSRARGHAAALLRQASRDRIVAALGLPVDAPPAAVADEITTRSRDEVLALLYGPEPGDDRALVRLADDLDALENEVCS
ncbi:DUF4350 domain-containing protein [Lentzea sp. NBRC 105346]|uniref:DUF4350 domain-containing protein n=1 Tax=Lentzea sp. NBRC 105346 TaxID=3032205 RepID=UPI0025540448|nr:DUF4350 domain-containing protein [Lentzea sp. NBRC 105346]